MNAAHLHLMFTHLPIVGIGIAVLLNLYAMFSKSIEVKKLTLWFYVMLGAFALLAYLTGDGAEEIIKTYPGISPDAIEDHEHIALFFFIGLLIISCVALIGLYLTKTKAHLLKKFNQYLLIAAILISLLAVKTGFSGGEIRHSEMKDGIYIKK